MVPGHDKDDEQNPYMGNKKQGSFLGNFKERHDINDFDAGAFMANMKDLGASGLNVGMDFSPLVVPKLAILNIGSEFAKIWDKIQGQQKERGWSWSDIKDEDISMFKESFSKVAAEIGNIMKYPSGALKDIGSAGMSFFNNLFSQVQACCSKLMDKLSGKMSSQAENDIKETAKIATEGQELVQKVATDNNIAIDTPKTSQRLDM